ncbi:MAG: hypothetical protein A4E57_04542 [Syntrophorhabdaceae bacterium PtaU1.Bin034]|nr:MAG: hypothetical protein A4E57_04542 [Syntrophorhabdaceae bacterium PtaU1.Bin034]
MLFTSPEKVRSSAGSTDFLTHSAPYGDDLPDELRRELNIPASVVACRNSRTSADVITSGSTLQFTVEVDTTQSEKRIKEEFARLVQYLKDISSMPDRGDCRDRSTALDHWEIYALYRQGKSKAEIVTEKFGLTVSFRQTCVKT